MKDEETGGASSYMNHVANAASYEAFLREDVNPLLSAETLPESGSVLEFGAFAAEYPEKFISFLNHLRPEWQEIAVEYYVLHKSQAFIGKAHGEIQTRVWQQLRIIEQTIGSMILLGPDMNGHELQAILEKAGLETTPYGSLTNMILWYKTSQSYTQVAHAAGAPVPAIRKIFRPAITALLADKDVKTVAVGAYLRGLTHQASLTGVGLSKRCQARTRRVKTLRFTAPPSDDSPLISFGMVASLRDTPWFLLEVSSEYRMNQLGPILRSQGKRVFGKKAAQIFAPVNPNGELEFGYLFARSVSTALVRGLLRIRGISEMASVYNDDGAFGHAVTVPHIDVQKMMNTHDTPPPPVVRPQDFVEILTGPAARYCGTVVRMNAITEALTIEVNFPTGRQFLVTAEPSCVKLLPNVPKQQRKFWGTSLDGNS